MHIEPSLPKPVICVYFKKIVRYTVLSFCSLMLIPSYALAAKTKKAAVATDQKQQERILAYTALYLENPGKLAKYMAVYHKESNCIVLDINKIDLSNEATIMHTIYCGQQLNSLLQHKEKAAWSLAQRYYTAYSLARLDLNSYQNYRKGLGKHDCTFEGLLAGAIVDAIQTARFRDQDAIFARMVPYMMRLFPIKEQVRLSKVQVMTLATAEPVLHEPAGL